MRARRGAARPAGHAVRPQHDRRPDPLTSAASPTDEFDGYVDLTGAEYNQFKFEGAFGGPISRHRLGRLSVATNNHDGYTEEPLRRRAGLQRGRFQGGARPAAVRAVRCGSILLSAPTGPRTMRPSAPGSTRRRRSAVRTASQPAARAERNRTRPSTATRTLAGRSPTCAPARTASAIATPTAIRGRATTTAMAVFVETKARAASSTSTGASATRRSPRSRRAERRPAAERGHRGEPRPAHSADLRRRDRHLHAGAARWPAATDSALKWLGGLYYFHNEVDGHYLLDLTNLGFVFFDANYTQRVEVAGRRSASSSSTSPDAAHPDRGPALCEREERRSTTSTSTTSGLFTDVVACRPTSRSTSTRASVGDLAEHDDDSVNGQLGLDFKPTDDVLLYGAIARGTKSAGLQRRLPRPER